MSHDAIATGQDDHRARWQAIAAGDCIETSLDSLTLLYDRRSGLTHLLGPPLPQLIALLRDAPLTLAELAARAADAFDLPDDAEALIAARVDELAALGLVTSTGRGA